MTRISTLSADNLAVGESIIAVDHHRILPNPLVNASPILNRIGGVKLQTPLDCRLIESVEVAHREEVVVQPHYFRGTADRLTLHAPTSANRPGSRRCVPLGITDNIRRDGKGW